MAGIAKDHFHQAKFTWFNSQRHQEMTGNEGVVDV
jgi:hypothetical protein